VPGSKFSPNDALPYAKVFVRAVLEAFNTPNGVNVNELQFDHTVNSATKLDASQPKGLDYATDIFVVSRKTLDTKSERRGDNPPSGGGRSIAPAGAGGGNLLSGFF
jgi:hypothetical protein